MNSLMLPLHYGRLPTLAAFFMHALPLVLAAVSCLPIQVVGIIAGCVGSSFFFFWRDVQRRKGAVLELFDSGAALLRSTRDPSGVPVQIDDLPVDLGWLIVLRWVEPETAKAVYAPLTSGSFSPEAWRALRIWLRWRLKTTSA